MLTVVMLKVVTLSVVALLLLLLLVLLLRHNDIHRKINLTYTKKDLNQEMLIMNTFGLN
jgi:hypothetical protein